MKKVGEYNSPTFLINTMIKFVKKVRFWRIKGEPKSPSREELIKQRVNYEKLTLSQYKKSLPKEQAKYLVLKPEHARNRIEFSKCMGQKIHSSRQFLKEEQTVAACIILRPITRWYLTNKNPIPMSVEELIIHAMYLDAKRT